MCLIWLRFEMLTKRERERMKFCVSGLQMKSDWKILGRANQLEDISLQSFIHFPPWDRWIFSGDRLIIFSIQFPYNFSRSQGTNQNRNKSSDQWSFTFRERERKEGEKKLLDDRFLFNKIRTSPCVTSIHFYPNLKGWTLYTCVHLFCNTPFSLTWLSSSSSSVLRVSVHCKKDGKKGKLFRREKLNRIKDPSRNKSCHELFIMIRLK